MANIKIMIGIFVLIVLGLAGFYVYSFNANHATGLASIGDYEGPFFEINVEIPEEYMEVLSGEKILTYIEIKNLGEGGRRDVILSYTLRDSNNIEILSKSETVAVETENSFVRYVNLPPSLDPGIYTIEFILSYSNGNEALGDASFRVVKE